MTQAAVGALIPIRLSSSRLRGKALKPIVGRPAVHHLLDRCFASRHLTPERVVVCTTTDPADDPLVPVVEATGAKVFRGHRDDLVDRLYRAASAYGFDVVAEVDGDDICVDPFYLDLCVDRLLTDERLDVVCGEGLPFSISARVVRTRALQTVFERYTPGKNDTGFMYYLTRSNLFRVGGVTPVSPRHAHPTLRLTLDYEEDLALFRAIFAALYQPGRVFGIEEIVALVQRQPELLQLNAGLEERYWQRTRELIEGQAMEIRTPEGIRRIGA